MAEKNIKKKTTSRSAKRKVVLCRIFKDHYECGYKLAPEGHALGLSYIKSYCLSNPKIASAFDIQIKVIRLEESPKKIAAALLKDKPEIIGFTCYNPEYRETIETARAIKKKSPETLIVLGGPSVYLPELEINKYDFIDIVVPYEGELPFEDILLSILESGKLDRIKGIAFRDGDKTCFTGYRDEHVDLAKIPSIYADEYLDGHNGMLLYQTSRGCVFNCAYCSASCIKYREFPLETVLDDLARVLTKPNIRLIFFSDLDMAINVDRFIEILEFIAEHNLLDTSLNALLGVHPRMIRSVEAMKKAGFIRAICIPLQSGNPEALKLSRRSWMTLEHLDEIAPKVLKYFPDAIIDLILGLPGETAESYRKTYYHLFKTGFRSLHPMLFRGDEGSDFYNRRAEFGLVFNDDVNRYIKSTPTFTEEELQSTIAFTANFNALTWILQPSDVPLYEEWGIDLMEIADRFHGLRNHCDQPTDIKHLHTNLSFAAVDERAIDALTDFLRDDYGFDKQKTRLINEYLHFKYRLYAYERTEWDHIEAKRPENVFPLLRGHLETVVSPEILDVLKIEPGSYINTAGKVTVFAMFNRKHSRVLPTVSRKDKSYRELLDAAAVAPSLKELFARMDTSDVEEAAKMLHRLADTGFLTVSSLSDII